MKDKLAKTTGEAFLKMAKEQNEGNFPIDIRVDRVSMQLKKMKILGTFSYLRGQSLELHSKNFYQNIQLSIKRRQTNMLVDFYF